MRQTLSRRRRSALDSLSVQAWGLTVHDRGSGNRAAVDASHPSAEDASHPSAVDATHPSLEDAGHPPAEDAGHPPGEEAVAVEPERPVEPRTGFRRRGAHSDAPPDDGAFALRATAGGLSLAGGLVHLVLAFQHGGLDLAAFGSVGVLQVAWGGAVLALPQLSARLLLTGAWLHLVCVAAWSVSRSLGLPLGQLAGEVQTVGLLDGVVVGCQLLAAVAAAGLAGGIRLGRAGIATAVIVPVLAASGIAFGLTADDGADDHEAHERVHDHGEVREDAIPDEAHADDHGQEL